jgi:hypothetical protein
MKKLALLFVALCFSLVAVGGAGAALVVDQHQDTYSGHWLNMGYASPLGQEFVPDVSNLAAVELYVNLNSGTSGPELSVNIREETITGDILATGAIDSTVQGWNLVTLDDYAWLEVGSLYVIQFISTSPNGVCLAGDYYEDGAYIFQGTPKASGTDLSFRTYYDDTATVPVPAAVWLLGSGLLGLIGIRRKNS